MSQKKVNPNKFIYLLENTHAFIFYEITNYGHITK
jgi:hypothetical protein